MFHKHLFFFYFDISVVNNIAIDIAIDVAKSSLPGKVMQGSPCPEVRTLTIGNWHYIMKLNDTHFLHT